MSAHADEQEPAAWVITELDVALAAPPAEDEPHPERTPVGTFPSREAADLWAEAWIGQHGGNGSWTVASLRTPDRLSLPGTAADQ